MHNKFAPQPLYHCAERVGYMTSSFLFRDTNDDLTHTNQMLSDLDLLDVATPLDKAVCRYLCAALTIRATQFISACMYCTNTSTLFYHLRRDLFYLLDYVTPSEIFQIGDCKKKEKKKSEINCYVL